MSEGRPTFYSPNDEALCLALIDFMDTATTEKREKYLGSCTHRMMERMHIEWMTRNGETDPLKVNRFKRLCQVVDLAWIEAKFPDLFIHLSLEARFYTDAFQGRKQRDLKTSMKEHFENCPFCNPNMRDSVRNGASECEKA